MTQPSATVLDPPSCDVAAGSAPLAGRRVVHVVLNAFVSDARVLRAARLGVEMGARVQVFGMHAPGLGTRETVHGLEVRRFPVRTRSWSKRRAVQLLKLTEVSARMVRAAVSARPALVHAHDINTLPIGWAVARLTGARLVYDSHELWSEVHQLSPIPGWMMRSGLAMERTLARAADGVVTVSEGIADEMAARMGIARPLVVRNVPAAVAPRPGADCLRPALGLSADVPVILYQGGVSHGRGVGTLLEAVARLSHPTALLVVLGDGPMVPELMARQEADPRLHGRVRFHPAVPSAELRDWTRGATIGANPLEGAVLNHRYALPNKLFEYLQAGLPVAVSDMPEIRRVVEQHGAGAVFPAGDAVALSATLAAMLADPAALAGMAAAARRAGAMLCWENERQILAGLYMDLLRLR